MNTEAPIAQNKKLLLKEKQLIEHAKSVLNDPLYQDELSILMHSLYLTKKQVISGYVNYDLDIFNYENEIYDSLVMRFVLHLHNLLKDSWHIERQHSLFNYLKNFNNKRIIDIGFGTPSLYVKKLLQKKNSHVTLCDLSDSAFHFAKHLLNLWDENWHNSVTMKKLNMEDGKYVGHYDVYIFQDSIEHVSDPTSYLITQVESAPLTSNFILSIPIGPMIPSHHIEWKNKEDAVYWLDCCGLKVIDMNMVHINPKVDLFAEQLDYNLYDLYVLCEKKIYA